MELTTKAIHRLMVEGSILEVSVSAYMPGKVLK
jgi:hypothetical protein